MPIDHLLIWNNQGKNIFACEELKKPVDMAKREHNYVCVYTSVLLDEYKRNQLGQSS